MISQKRLLSTLLIGILMALLSGCGSETTASSVVEALKDEDYDKATQIFDDAVYESDEPYEIHEATSQAIREYLDEIYGNYYDTSDEDSFYTLLDNIENIGIDDEELSDAISEFRGFKDGRDSVDDSYTNDDESYDEDESNYDDSYDDEEYTEDDEYYEEEEVSSENPYTATSIDHDCTDFATQEDAQLFYEANGGPEYDPHDLDRDNDGMACDWN
ncbi:excalibur calcium-binding domain-containing protein [Bacillus sp. 1P10SD]|uniref:excalibur calcium-binding domain-containing protein n=1 Tax=Bacillus sp. 1P10SD TaxID=3132265 RepID=UPI0039A4F6F2